MKIAVAIRHVRDGRRGDIHDCPLARAFRDAGFRKAWVGVSSLFWTDRNGSERSAALPQVVIDWMTVYDLGIAAAPPFSFDFEAKP